MSTPDYDPMSNSLDHELEWFKQGLANCGPRTANLVALLQRENAKLRERCNRLRRQRDWLRIQQQATSPKPLPTEDTEHPEKPATTKHTKPTKGKP